MDDRLYMRTVEYENRIILRQSKNQPDVEEFMTEEMFQGKL